MSCCRSTKLEQVLTDLRRPMLALAITVAQVESIRVSSLTESVLRIRGVDNAFGRSLAIATSHPGADRGSQRQEIGNREGCDAELGPAQISTTMLSHERGLG